MQYLYALAILVNPNLDLTATLSLNTVASLWKPLVSFCRKNNLIDASMWNTTDALWCVDNILYFLKALRGQTVEVVAFLPYMMSNIYAPKLLQSVVFSVVE